MQEVQELEYLRRRVADLETFVVSIDEQKAFHEYIKEYGETKEKIDTGEEEASHAGAGRVLPLHIEVSGESHLNTIFEVGQNIPDEELEGTEIYQNTQFLSKLKSVTIERSHNHYCVEVTREDGSYQAIYVDGYHNAVMLANELCSIAGLPRYTFSFCYE